MKTTQPLLLLVITDVDARFLQKILCRPKSKAEFTTLKTVASRSNLLTTVTVKASVLLQS